MNFAKAVDNLEKKAARHLGLGALSLSLLTGCSPASEQTLDHRAVPSDGIIRSFEPRQPSTKMSYLDVCQKLSEDTRRFSALLDNDPQLAGEPLKQFVETLQNSYQALLQTELDPSLSQRDKDMLAVLREDIYKTYRTAAADRLTSRSSKSHAENTVDGNSEMVYRLIAQLDTALIRLAPSTPPASK